MKSTLARFRSFYGSTPLHLLGMLLCFALVAYTVATVGISALWDPSSWWQSILVWFAGAVLFHDLVLFPLYALADRVVHRGLAAQGPQGHDRGSRVSPVNYIRVPALAVGLLFLMFFPGLFKQGAASYLRATGQTQAPFLLRWVILAVVILALGALAYVVARARARTPAPGGGESTDAE